MPSQDIQLYHFPGSYFTQKVRVALAERKIKHKETIVSLFHFDQHQPWFLKINPNGQVPLLRVGKQYTCDSDRILEVIDQLESSEGKLIPDPSTPFGKSVAEWMSKLGGIKIEVLTFGTFLNPSLSVTGLKTPPSMKMTMEGYKANMNNSIKNLEKTKAKNPGLAACIDKLIERQKQREEAKIFDPENVKSILKELDVLFDEVEQQLRASRAENIVEHWLCGPSFTAADIVLCMLLGRLTVLGDVERYADPQKRPAVVEYWNQAVQRPSVKTMILGAMPQVKAYFIKRKLTSIGTKAVIAGAVVLAGVYVAKKLKS